MNMQTVLDALLAEGLREGCYPGAVAACGCMRDVIVPDAQCVNKSYPAFWNDMKRLEVE